MHLAATNHSALISHIMGNGICAKMQTTSGSTNDSGDLNETSTKKDGRKLRIGVAAHGGVSHSGGVLVSAHRADMAFKNL